jgi:hypothetical protein
MRLSAQRKTEIDIDLGSVDVVDWDRSERSDGEARSAVLDAHGELNILEGVLDEFKDPPALATPRIVTVEQLGAPVLTGDLDVPLAANQALHVFDAMTGEDLGPALVNHLWWTFTDTRVLSSRQLVVYVARLRDERGEEGELSNACEVIVGFSANEVRSAAAENSGGEMIAGSGPATVAVITQVTSQGSEKVLVQSRTRAELRVGGRWVILGALSAALRPGERVQVFDGSIDLGSATVNGQQWMFCDTRVLRVSSVLSYTAYVVDTAGNLGPASSIVMLTAGESS